jgi:glycosyltransferase involved in cell wall biosynthesis
MSSADPGPGTAMPRLSVIVPVRNEAGNIGPLIAEIEKAAAPLGDFEIIYVDDGSSDATGDELQRTAKGRPWLRQIRHAQSCGQSGAIRSGVRAARAPLIVTLDGDGQNDPAFIPAFIAKFEQAGAGCGLVQGQRVGRKDTGFKKFQSRVANRVRQAILKDGTRDTGCGFKCFPREVYFALPYFDALHRFMPALVKREGYTLAFVDVVDRPRLSGRSNYGFFDRLWIGIVDLAGVRWLIERRKRLPAANEVKRS